MNIKKAALAARGSEPEGKINISEFLKHFLYRILRFTNYIVNFYSGFDLAARLPEILIVK